MGARQGPEDPRVKEEKQEEDEMSKLSNCISASGNSLACLFSPSRISPRHLAPQFQPLGAFKTQT